jgi:hypothetical protein
MARVILSEASVRISADTRGGERDAERAGEDYGREYARGARRQTERNPAKLKVDPLTEDFQQQVRAMVARVSREANLNVPLTMGGEKLRAQLAVQIGEIERTMKADIPTDPADALGYRRKLALLVREAERTVRSRIDVDVDVDRSGNILRRAASRLSSVFATSFTNTSKDSLGGLVTASSGVFGSIGSQIKDMAASAVGSFTSMIGPLGSVIKLIFGIQYVVPALAAGISLVGGAGVAAFGAVSAAALGLPALMMGIAAPIAAITLGMDGIKRAAAPLSDEIKLLRDVLNITFELTMRPVFEKLQVIFPTLTAGLSETARAVSRVAMDMAGVITSEAGIENLRVAFAGVSDMIDRSREGLRGLFTSLLNVAGTRELYDILGDTIGGVAARFGNMIERVRSSGDLTAALASLRDVLFGVVDMLNVLIEGSIKFFAASGPGLTSFFASLTEVLSRIDWAGLGAAFGGMMERLGTAIQNIPPEKWQELADSIGALSEKFIKMVEEGAFIDFIEAISGIANALLLLKSAIDGIEEGINGLNDMLSGAGQSIYDNVTGPFYRAVGDLFQWLGIGSPAQKFIDIALAIIEGFIVGMAGGPAAVFGKIKEIGQAALNALADAGTFLLDKGHQLAEGLRRGIGDKVGDLRAKAVELKDNIKSALGDAGSFLYSVGQSVAQGLARGISAGISWVTTAARNLAQRAYDAAKSVIQPGSPSRLFTSLGLTIGPGLAAGIEQTTNQVLAAISRMLGSVASLLPVGIGDTIRQALSAGMPRLAGQISVDATQQSIGSARSTIDTQAIVAALSATQWTARFDGPNVIQVVNDGNRQLARR